MTAIDVAYGKLLHDDLPHAIHNEKDYRTYLARVEELFDKKNRSAAENRYLELLSVLIERYEQEHDPIVAPDPLDALKELMAANGMSQSALARLLGSSGITSEILSGKRSLSKTHIKKLAAAFNVSTDLFV
ncbi:MAG: helix-turn-helix domain-containing protein [Candidatus Aquilonibacter sp.]|jgi:HTH-type transcriptional regulator/antitoxin HigA